MNFVPIPNFDGYGISKDGEVYSYVTNRKLKSKIENTGYCRISLVKNGKRKMESIHRLLAITFLGEPSGNNTIVNHKNGIKEDNRLENLEWCSQRDNAIHYIVYMKKFGKFSTENQLEAFGISENYTPKKTSENNKTYRLFSKEEYDIVYDLCEKKIPVRFIARKFEHIGVKHIKKVYNFINGYKIHYKEV